MSRIDLEQISTSVRGAITAPPGEMLVVSDLSSIESRLAGWVTGCGAINHIFQHGKDVYKDLASKIYSIPYAEVTKEQRTFAKPAALGAQYMLGGKGLVAYASQYGVKMDLKEAEAQIKIYRAAYPEVPQCWDWLKGAIFDVIKGTKQGAGRYGLFITREKMFLTIQIPSGRKLYYHRPEVIWGEAPWLDENGETVQIEKFAYMGKDSFTFQWKQITAHAGGVFENIIQAIARDILAVWLLRADQKQLNLVGHVHDEVICLEDEWAAEGILNQLNYLISSTGRPIPWAPDLLLDAEGYTAKRYRKD